MRWGKNAFVELALEGCALSCEFQSWLTLFPLSKPVVVVNTLKTTVTHQQPVSVGSWDWEDTEHLVLQNIITIIT